MSNKKNQSTILARAGIGKDPAFGSVMPPIYLSSTYALSELGEKKPYNYSRTKNPTRDTLASLITKLECGYDTHVVNSGMASLTLILQLLNSDDLILAPYDCYGRSYALMVALAKKGHFKLEFVDTYDTPKMSQIIEQKNPRIVLIESPSNPVLRTADIRSIVAYSKKAGSIVACDNTFLSPILLRPIELGADITFSSTTKFINGHSDIIGGSVTTATEEIWKELDFWSNSLGLSGDAFSSYMTLRGARTLSLRIERAQENAGKIAKFLECHEGVTNVFYPGLESHPHHTIAKSQQDGFGAIISFEAKKGAKETLDKLKLFPLAQSLGGVESLINHPASMTHVAMGKEARDKAGVTDSLLRLSVGIENASDLIADLEQALS